MIRSRGDTDTDAVKLGLVEHQSLPAHYFECILIQIVLGIRMNWLKPGDKPESIFIITDEAAVECDYFNLHGLWRVKMYFVDALIE